MTAATGGRAAAALGKIVRVGGRELNFDPNQPRDADGQWTDGAVGGGGKWSVDGPDKPITRPGASGPAGEGKKAFNAIPEHTDIKTKLSPEVQKNFDLVTNQYVKDDYIKLNRTLRAGGSDGYVKMQTEVLDAAIDASPMEEDIVVWRGMNGRRVFPADWFEKSLVGASWEDASFGSTSADKGVAERFIPDSMMDSFKTRVLMRIVVPKGAKALRLGDFSTFGKGGFKEAELLLGRNNKFRVVADHGKDKKGVRRIDVEMIPGTPKPVN